VSPSIEKLLIIQERDRRVLQLDQELKRIPDERAEIEARAKAATSRLEELKLKARQIESERKELENQVAAKRELINKWRAQQVLTKKNEEYQALTHEIENAEKEIFKIEDKELDLMETAEKLAAEIRKEQQVLTEVSAVSQRQRQTLDQREAAIKAEMEKLKADRGTLCKDVDPSMMSRYERIMRHRKDSAVVPVQHGICGGCHLQIPPQVMHQAKSGEELVTCDQCGRILYWSREFEPVPQGASH